MQSSSDSKNDNNNKSKNKNEEKKKSIKEILKAKFPPNQVKKIYNKIKAKVDNKAIMY